MILIRKLRLKQFVLSLVFISALTLILSGCKLNDDVIFVDSISISAANNATTISTLGGTLQFSAEVLPEDADDTSVVWSVENGTGEAMIDQDGLLSAVSNGTVTVRATSNDGSDISDSMVITISNQAVVLITHIEISSAGDAIIIDTSRGTLQFTANVFPADATDKSVVWSVENGTGEATIDQDGLLSAVANGTVTVKATSSDGSEVLAEMVITISNQEVLVVSIEIQSAEDAIVIDTFGGTLQFTAIVLPANAADKSVIWSVVNGTGEATISSNGLLTAVSNGTVAVKVAATHNDSIFDLMLITISNQEILISSISVTTVGGGSTISTFGGTLQMVVNILPLNATNQAVVWSVENGTGEATINQDGILTAVSDGTVIVKATSEHQPLMSGTRTITISNQEVGVSSISVTGFNDATTISVANGTLQMIAHVLPLNATDKSVMWSVENVTGEAIIDQNGILTAVSDGTVIVKAVAASNYSIFGTEEITLSNQDSEEPLILAVDLKSADAYTILAKTGVSTASTSNITGDIGVSPAPASYITGFSLIMHSSNEYSTSSQVTGKIYASDYTPPTPTLLTVAIGDMEAAYTDAAGRAPNFTELYAGDLSGQTLTVGVYKYGGDVLINTNVTLFGSATDVIIFQISGSLVQAAGIQVILTGGLLAENIFWQVAGNVAIGTNAHMEGTILCMTSIALNTGASINGKLFAQTAVTLDGNDIN